MPSAAVEKLEERWTPSTVQTAFAIRSLPRIPSKSGGISVDLPLLPIGWTFALSLTPQAGKNQRRGSSYGYGLGRACTSCNWIPAALSFRQHSDTIRWGNSTICAEISLEKERTPDGSDSTSLGGMRVVLAHTPSLQLPLSTSCTLSSLKSDKVRLTVTISNCPFPNGLFDARYGPVNEAEVQAQLVRQSGDRVLNQSLTTGKLFDVKFLAFSALRESGHTGRPLPIYASLSVVEKHVDLSSSALKKGWTNALSALDDTEADHVPEISCPEDYEYELDSDFEDEDGDEASPRPSGEAALVLPEDQHPDNIIEVSSSSLSSFELEGVSDQGSVDNKLEELIQDVKEAPSSHERTVWVKFAAHRTWHAFLWYCYTGNLEFSKLKSQIEPGGKRLRVTPSDGGPPTCSPKSMYRLADLLGDKDLKAKALTAIKERMTEVNVLDEAFSVFTSRYPDVREAQLEALMGHCESPKVKEAFLKAMEKYGSMPHAKPVLSAFFDNLVA